MTDDFNEKLCLERHSDLERRMSVVEESIKTNLDKIYTKLDRPSWFVVTLLSGSLTAIGVMGMWILTHH